MINVTILIKIRHWHFRDQLSLREIARRTGLSRNTVRNYVKNDKFIDQVYPQRVSPNKLDNLI